MNNSNICELKRPGALIRLSENLNNLPLVCPASWPKLAGLWETQTTMDNIPLNLDSERWKRNTILLRMLIRSRFQSTLAKKSLYRYSSFYWLLKSFNTKENRGHHKILIFWRFLYRLPSFIISHYASCSSDHHPQRKLWIFSLFLNLIPMNFHGIKFCI